MKVPALRDRREDIPYLTAAFVRDWACILADSEFIADREFSIGLSGAVPGFPARSSQPDEGTLSAVERDRIVEVMVGVGGNKSKAAKILGLDRRSLYRRLELYGIDKAADGTS